MSTGGALLILGLIVIGLIVLVDLSTIETSIQGLIGQAP